VEYAPEEEAVTEIVAETEPLEGTWTLVGLMVKGGPPVDGKADKATEPENPCTLESVTVIVALDP
jgi:hypothetical protein